jgi:hypothetical protein
MRSRLHIPTACSSCRSFALWTNSDRAMGEAVSRRSAFAASQPAQSQLSPSQGHHGFSPHGMHNETHPKVHAHLFATHLRLQTSLLTCGSAGQPAVTCQPKQASAATTKTFFTPHHHTPRTATEKHNKLHRKAMHLLWYVFHQLAGAQQRILTWPCRFASFAVTAALAATRLGRICHPHPQHTFMRLRLDGISSARPRTCFRYVVGLMTPCMEPLLTFRDRDFHGGLLRLLTSAVNNTTTRSRQEIHILDLEEVGSYTPWLSSQTAYTWLCSARGHSPQQNFATSRCPIPQRILGSGPSRVSEQARARSHKDFVHLDKHK